MGIVFSVSLGQPFKELKSPHVYNLNVTLDNLLYEALGIQHTSSTILLKLYNSKIGIIINH